MSKSGRFILVMAVAASLAACAQKEEEVVVVEPVTAEPEFTGKYK